MAEAAAPEAAEPEAAAPESAEVVSTTTPPTEGEEPEVVLGRRLLLSTAEIPLPRLIAKCQQAQQELEAGMRWEWEKLEAERHRLSDWEERLGDRIKSVTARYADERPKLVLERELLQEGLQRALDREAAAAKRERAATRREADALERELAAEKKVQAAADRERTALELASEAKKVVEMTAVQEATLAELAAVAAKREERLAAREAEEVAWLQELQRREEAVEEELAAGTRRVQEHEVALQEREAKVAELLAERSASIGQITRWVGAVNPLLEALGANPIRVPEAPSPLGTGLHRRAVAGCGGQHLRPPGDRRASSCSGDGRVHPHQLPEPRPRHPTDSCPSRTPPSNGSRRARSPGDGRHGRGTHPTPP
jgi:hypothetical protein